MTTVTVNVPDYLAPLLADIGDQLPLVIELGMSRLDPVSTQAYMEALALFAKGPSPEMITKFRFSAALEERIQELLEKNENDALSKAEKVELHRLSHLEGQLQLIKAKALVSIKSRA